MERKSDMSTPNLPLLAFFYFNLPVLDLVTITDTDSSKTTLIQQLVLVTAVEFSDNSEDDDQSIHLIQCIHTLLLGNC